LEEPIPIKPIVIVGAGIGGLVAALALQQRDFEVALYEQARDLREAGAGVQISPNGTRVLYDLGLADAIRAGAGCLNSFYRFDKWSLCRG
jgi:salicylate hydroxylase